MEIFLGKKRKKIPHLEHDISNVFRVALWTKSESGQNFKKIEIHLEHVISSVFRAVLFMHIIITH